MPSVLIRNGMIVDGTGREGFNGSVLVVGDKIMVSLLAAAFDSGAFGLSFGLMYPPGLFSSKIIY